MFECDVYGVASLALFEVSCLDVETNKLDAETGEGHECNHDRDLHAEIEHEIVLLFFVLFFYFFEKMHTVKQLFEFALKIRLFVISHISHLVVVQEHNDEEEQLSARR